MKTEPYSTETINQNTATEIMNPNTPKEAASDIPATAIATQAQTNNAERLADLATSIRVAYKETVHLKGQITDGQNRLVNWKRKQLEVGLEIGKHLLEAKALLPHGKFTGWCRDNLVGLTHRTLNRYMRIAEDSDEKHVSTAGGLRQAYERCTSDRQTEEMGEAELLRRDFEKVQRYLSKAICLLNPYPDPTTCEEADRVCDLVDALTDWVTGYRASSNALARHRDTGVEVSFGDDTQPEASEDETVFSTAE